MHSRKKRLESCRLYLVLDAGVASYKDLYRIAQESIEAGIDLLQLRDKTGSDRCVLDFAAKLKRLAKQDVPIIMNDRADLAHISDVDGVHLGQEDGEIESAREMLGEDKIIGKSAQSLEDALKAEADGADYIGFGSVFKTLTKPDREPMNLDLLKSVTQQIEIPLYPIGGINLDNINKVLEAGAQRAAVTRSIMLSENINQTISEFKTLISAQDYAATC